MPNLKETLLKIIGADVSEKLEEEAPQEDKDLMIKIWGECKSPEFLIERRYGYNIAKQKIREKIPVLIEAILEEIGEKIPKILEGYSPLRPKEFREGYEKCLKEIKDILATFKDPKLAKLKDPRRLDKDLAPDRIE